MEFLLRRLARLNLTWADAFWYRLVEEAFGL
jgi:hypothetical protein